MAVFGGELALGGGGARVGEASNAAQPRARGPAHQIATDFGVQGQWIPHRLMRTSRLWSQRPLHCSPHRQSGLLPSATWVATRQS